MKYKQKLKIYEKAVRIFESDLPWDKKYDMIFSKEISRNFSFDWYDPDCDYDDDVRAYMSALKEHMDEQKLIYDQIGEDEDEKTYDSMTRDVTIPTDAHSFEVFAIKDATFGKEAFLGYKLANGDFHFIQVPYTGGDF